MECLTDASERPEDLGTNQAHAGCNCGMDEARKLATETSSPWAPVGEVSRAQTSGGTGTRERPARTVTQGRARRGRLWAGRSRAPGPTHSCSVSASLTDACARRPRWPRSNAFCFTILFALLVLHLGILVMGFTFTTWWPRWARGQKEEKRHQHRRRRAEGSLGAGHHDCPWLAWPGPELRGTLKAEHPTRGRRCKPGLAPRLGLGFCVPRNYRPNSCPHRGLPGEEALFTHSDAP